MNWLASGGTQLILLVLVVVGVALMIGLTVRRERAAARLARRRAEADPRLGTPVLVAPGPTLAADALALLEFEDEPGIVPIRKKSVTIGRHSDDAIRLKDVSVSRHHAILQQRDGGRFEIINQTASRPEPNPILINGVYKEKSDLADGDVVKLGGVTFRFRDKTAVSA